MLILSRRSGEALKIGDDVIVTVLGVRGCQVRIGIAAPKSIGVYREELLQRMQDRGAQEIPDDGAQKPPSILTPTEPGAAFLRG